LRRIIGRGAVAAVASNVVVEAVIKLTGNGTVPFYNIRPVAASALIAVLGPVAPKLAVHISFSDDAA